MLLLNDEPLTVDKTGVRKWNCLGEFTIGEGFPLGVEYIWENSAITSAPDYCFDVLEWCFTVLNEIGKLPSDNEYSILEKMAESEIRKIPYSAKRDSITHLLLTIYRRLFRCYAILYSSCFHLLEGLDLVETTNSNFKFFCFFGIEYSLTLQREVSPIDVVFKPLRVEYENCKRKAKLIKSYKNIEPLQSDMGGE